MLFQLVLQFRGESLPKLQELDTLDEQIEDVLSESESFDGMDQRDQGVNIFIYTENPADTFQRVRPLFEKAERLLGFSAAYRLVAGNRFHTLWPEEGIADFQLRVGA